MIDDLLALASPLASGASGAGKPKSVELRRAASTVYYALFHESAQLCAAQLVGATKPWRLFNPIYRSLDHQKSRQVLDQLRRADPESTFASLALVFPRLQDARYDADSNPEPFRFNRGGTIELVVAGRQAVDLLRGLPPEQKLMLAVRLLATRKRSA